MITIDFAKIIFFIMWIWGVVLANGFWSTLIAFFIPFWAWYLVVESLLIKYGIT